MIFLYVAVALFISFLVGRNSKNSGHGFWRSFIFMLLLFAVVLAFLMKQLKDVF